MVSAFKFRRVSVVFGPSPHPDLGVFWVLWLRLTPHGSIQHRCRGCTHSACREASPGKHGFFPPINRRIYCLDFGQNRILLLFASSSIAEQPRMRFLYVGSGFRLGLLSDSVSRRTPLPLTRGSFCQGPQRTFTSENHQIFLSKRFDGVSCPPQGDWKHPCMLGTQMMRACARLNGFTEEIWLPRHRSRGP